MGDSLVSEAILVQTLLSFRTKVTRREKKMRIRQEFKVVIKSKRKTI